METGTLKFYYQIKGRKQDGNWTWPPLYSGIMESTDRKAVRKALEDEFGVHLPGALLKNNEHQHLLLTIDDVTHKKYILDRFIEKECSVCATRFSDNEKYLIGISCSREFCSNECQIAYKAATDVKYSVNFDFEGIHEAVIYKIANKTTGQVYIGKTTQAFTLRWYQHIYQGTSGKFQKAISEYGINGFTFEVIEIVSIPAKSNRDEKHKIILERESYWIRHYNSVHDGYNSVISKKEEVNLPTLFDEDI